MARSRAATGAAPAPGPRSLDRRCRSPRRAPPRGRSARALRRTASRQAETGRPTSAAQPDRDRRLVGERDRAEPDLLAHLEARSIPAAVERMDRRRDSVEAAELDPEALHLD